MKTLIVIFFAALMFVGTVPAQDGSALYRSARKLADVKKFKEAAS